MKFYVNLKPNAEAPDRVLRTFIKESDDLVGAIAAAKAEASSLWSVRQTSIWVVDAGPHVSLAEASAARSLTLELALRTILSTYVDVEAQVQALVRFIESGEATS